MANSQEVYLGDSNNDRQSETAAETGNTCISETVKSTVKIPTTNLRYKTSYRWKIVSASKYNSDRQPDLSIWPPKPEIITSLELWQIASKFQRQIRDFRWCPARKKISQMICEQNVYICHFRLSDVVAIARRQLLRAGRGRKPRFAVGIAILSVILPEIWVFPVSVATLPFPVVGHCRNHLATLYWVSPCSTILDLALEFRRYLL